MHGFRDVATPGRDSQTFRLAVHWFARAGQVSEVALGTMIFGEGWGSGHPQ